MEEELVFDNYFNGKLFNKVCQIRNDLEKKEKVVAHLRTLCELDIDYLVLDCSMIEATVSKLYRKINKKHKPICQYLLRRWDNVNKTQQVQKPECKRRKLVKQERTIEKVVVSKKSSPYGIEKAVDKKLYYENARREKKDTSTLFGLCKAKIEENLIDFLIKKKSMEPLVSKISGDTLARCEKQVPEITEFSEVLWRSLISRDFPALAACGFTSHQKDFYFHLLRHKITVGPSIQSFPLSQLRNRCILPFTLTFPPVELVPEEPTQPAEVKNRCFKALFSRILLNLSAIF